MRSEIFCLLLTKTWSVPEDLHGGSSHPLNQKPGLCYPMRSEIFCLLLTKTWSVPEDLHGGSSHPLNRKPKVQNENSRWPKNTARRSSQSSEKSATMFWVF